MFDKYGLKSYPAVRRYWLIARVASALVILPILLFIAVFFIYMIAYFGTGKDSLFTTALVWLDAVLFIIGAVVIPLPLIVLVLSTLIFLPYYFRLRSKAMVSSLLNDLRCSDATVRKSAIADVEKNRLSIAEGDLTTMLLADPDPDVALDAYLTLSQMGRPKLEYLLKAFESEKDETVQLRIIQLLRRIGDPRQIPVLMDVYPQVSGENVKKEILYSLNMFKSEALKAFLINTIRAEHVGSLRALAAGLLAKYDDPAIVAPLVEVMQEEKDRSCRLDIIKVLGRYNDRSSVEPLIYVMLKDENTDVRLAAMKVLEDIGDIRSIEPLRSLLQDPDMAIRDAAAEALHRQNAMPLTSNREVVREVVKVPCAYCGTLIEVTSKFCYACGAPFKV